MEMVDFDGKLMDFGGTTTLRSSKAAKTKMQPTSSEGRSATGLWKASVIHVQGWKLGF